VAPLQLAAEDFGEGLELSWTDVVVELGAADEPRVRDFFTRVAEAAGRRPPA
jgi:hypothetical protein